MFLQLLGKINLINLMGDHLRSTYAKLSDELTFLIP